MSYSHYTFKNSPKNSFKKYNQLCSFCGKRCYSKKEAQTALNFTKHSKDKHKLPIRMYYCDKCNSWHLTSQEKR